jgi:hypothetical protein
LVSYAGSDFRPNPVTAGTLYWQSLKPNGDLRVDAPDRYDGSTTAPLSRTLGILAHRYASDQLYLLSLLSRRSAATDKRQLVKLYKERFRQARSFPVNEHVLDKFDFRRGFAEGTVSWSKIAKVAKNAGPLRVRFLRPFARSMCAGPL